ncbi:MAG: ATPase, partial [Muribaculaceae bacterium]|nr:ATPase [Muribaculaceae bacterium]
LKAAQNMPEKIKVDDIYYYGAGCATKEICKKIKSALLSVWQPEICEVNSDLLGAARALFGNRKGIACILGTGSNSCLYDGGQIIMQIPSLGYVLGDEGSGAALGKRLIGDVFKEQLPASVREMFLEEYKLTLPEILEKIYKLPSPNRFLASFVPFLKKNLWNPYIYSLVLKELTRFVKRNVAMYPGAHALNVNFTGSVAFHFQNILKEATASLGYSVTHVTETPVDGLIDYHINLQA